MGRGGALHLPGELLQTLDEAVDAVHQMVDVEVRPERLRPLLTGGLRGRRSEKNAKFISQS